MIRQLIGGKNNANTVVGFFRKSELTFLPGGKAVLKNKVSFKNSYLLCSDERFCDQWIGPFCTGFAVSKNTIASAGHCMKDVSLADFVCIFGYQLSSKGQIVDTFYAEQILHPTEIVKNGLTESNPNDYLFLKVQENIPSQRISQLDPNPLKGASDKIYVIGHPCGIPMKIGLNGSIRDNTNPNFFVSTLDTYGGNSGSPVFKAANNKVIGSKFTFSLPARK